MKKLLLLIVAPLFIFCFTSCNDNGSTTKSSTSDSTVKDSAKIDTTKKVTSLAPAIDISFYKLPEGMGIKMKNWKNGCSSGNRKTPVSIKEIPNVRQAINDYYKDSTGCTIDSIQVRFKDKDDEDFYCKINKFESKPGYCDVKNYKLWIYRVTRTPLTGTNTYYEFVTICPPPPGECNKKDSSAAN